MPHVASLSTNFIYHSIESLLLKTVFDYSASKQWNALDWILSIYCQTISLFAFNSHMSEHVLASF